LACLTTKPTIREKDKKFIREKLNIGFSGVFEKELIDEIVDIGVYQKIDRGDLLIDIGDEMTHIPLIVNGVVKISLEDQNEHELLLYFLEHGDTCAISFVNCIHQSQSVFRGTIESDTECIMIPVNMIEEWLINYRSWREFIINSYHNRLVEMVEVLDNLAFRQLDHRILKYLSDEATILHNKDVAVSHLEIANDLNTSRVVVSRLLKILEKKGKIKLGRKSIKLMA